MVEECGHETSYIKARTSKDKQVINNGWIKQSELIVNTKKQITWQISNQLRIKITLRSNEMRKKHCGERTALISVRNNHV